MRIGRIALVASPAAFLAAAILHPPHGADAESWLASATAGGMRFYLAHLLFLVAAVALVPAAWEMARQLGSRGAGRGRLAAILTTLGGLGLATLVGMDFLVWRLAESTLGHEEMLGFLDDATTNPALIAPAGALLALGVAGIVLLAIELRRAALVAPPAAILIGTGPLLLFVLPLKPVSVFGGGLLLAGLCSLARSPSGGERRAVGRRVAPRPGSNPLPAPGETA
jgi:hypothetical protein